EEAAVIEGASAGKIFWRIVLPLAKPAVAITALFSFMTSWNEFILAATFMDKENMYTAPVGLRFFVGGFSQQWGYFAAGSIIVSIPVVLLFLYLQKYLVSGLTAGDKVTFAVSVNADIEDPWQMPQPANFSIQMPIIHIKTGKGGHTKGIPGTNVEFAAGEEWNKVVILSPQPAGRVKSEAKQKAADGGGDSVVPVGT